MNEKSLIKLISEKQSVKFNGESKNKERETFEEEIDCVFVQFYIGGNK